MNPIRKPFQYTFNNGVFVIAAINITLYLLMRFNISLKSALCLNVINCIKYKMWWQPLTYMFMHADFSHVFFNMLGLLIFGWNVERAVGTKEFVLMYLLCGVLVGFASLGLYWFFGMYRIFLLGASGAVYSILLAYAVIFPHSKIYLWWIIPVPAPLLVLGYAAIEFFSQFSGDGVAHSAHLLGFVFAFLYFRIRMGINPWKIWFGR